MTPLKNRYDFVLLFDVQDGNPNGDPDAGNMPRIDPETGHGLVTDVCLKRKVRNVVQLTRQQQAGFDIYVKERAILSEQQGLAYAKLGLKGGGETTEEKKAKKPRGAQADTVQQARAEMCRMFFDVRTFGAVMSLKEHNAGQVRGPVQLTFARSVDPIVTLEHAITRMAVATTKEADEQGGDNRTMGRKNTVPYGLYRGYGFVSAPLARQTGFSEGDLDVLWQSLGQMFEHDRSAARGLMALRKLVIFKHESELGSAPAHTLFERVKVARRDMGRPAREFSDYAVTIDDAQLPAGISVQVLPG